MKNHNSKANVFEDMVEIVSNNLVVRRESKDILSGSERMIALGGGIRARLGKTSDGQMVVSEFLFDRNKFSEGSVKEWMDKNSDSYSESLRNVQENAPLGSFADIALRLSRALEMANVFDTTNKYLYIAWIFPGHVIADYDGRYFKVIYEEDDKGIFSFQEPDEVDMKFVAKEGIVLNESLLKKNQGNCNIDDRCTVDFKEANIDRAEKRIKVILIEAGTSFGKRRHYPRRTIQEAAELFAGLKMYLDHPTDREDREKPERSLREWISTITESWYDNGKLIAWVTVHQKDFWDLLESDKVFREHVGISINTSGRMSEGMIDGEKMEIIDQIVAPRSADWVTEAGARGRVLNLVESNRLREEGKTMLKTVTLHEMINERPDLVKIIEARVREDMEKEYKIRETKAIQEAVKPLETKIAESDAREVQAKEAVKVRDLVEASKLPARSRERMITRLCEKSYESITKLEETVKAAIEEELKYLKEVGGVKIGAGEDNTKNEEGAEKITEGLEARLGIKKEEKK